MVSSQALEWCLMISYWHSSSKYSLSIYCEWDETPSRDGKGMFGAARRFLTGWGNREIYPNNDCGKMLISTLLLQCWWEGEVVMAVWESHLTISFKTKNILGAPVWLSQLSVPLQLRSWSCSLWVRAPRWALCCQLRAWSLLRILCLPLSLSLPQLILSPSLKNK